MKRLLLSLAIAASATGLQAQIAGSPHDLSSAGPGVKTNTTQTCVFCHTPHNAIGAGVNNTAQLIPLWNHSTTASIFVMYNQSNVLNNTLDGVVDASPSGASRACLSCHDGTLAVGNISNLPDGVATITYTPGGGVNGTGFIASGTALLGADLTNDHPISITYLAVDAGLKNPTTFAANGVKLFPTNVFGSKVQCASCHDVHNFGVLGTTQPFLRGTMAGSALCLQCHTK